MTYPEALAIIGGLGHASKMPCKTYSIPAKLCNRGSILKNVQGSICRLCYARRFNFTFPKVQEGMMKKAEAMKSPFWSEAMATVLKREEHSGYFRWFSSGDIQGLDNLKAICQVVKLTPKIKHWLPTHEVGVLGEFKRAGLKYPKNLIVRLSGDMIGKAPPASFCKSLGVLASYASKEGYTCPAPKQDNMCGQCRLCWDKRVPVVGYKLH